MNGVLFSYGVGCALRTNLLYPLPLGEGRVRAGLYRLRRWVNGFYAAGRAAAGYFFLFGQEKCNQKEGRPGAADTSCASRRRRGLPDGTSLCRWQVRAPGANRAARGLIRLRLRCSAAATGPDLKSNILVVCATRTLSVSGSPSRQSSPSTAARPGAVKRAPVRANRAVGAMRVAQRPASRGAQETARILRGERSGVLLMYRTYECLARAGMRVWARPFGYFSLHKQRKVTRPRRGSRTLAFQASPQAIQQEQVVRRVTALTRLTHPFFDTLRGH